MTPPTLRPRLSKAILVALTLAGFASLLALIAYLDVSLRYRNRIVKAEDVDQRPVAIVLGAGVYPSGRLTPVLADRMRTAIDLYQAGKVQKLLLSGDNSVIEYNEPARMGDFARDHGLPEAALAYDYAGRRTYDSCWRSRHIFGQRRVVIVTQAFHLPRALYLCQQMGVDAVGVAADRRFYTAAPFWAVREALARITAWLDVHLLHPQPVGGPPIDLFAQEET
jgi:SanA protein